MNALHELIPAEETASSLIDKVYPFDNIAKRVNAILDVGRTRTSEKDKELLRTVTTHPLFTMCFMPLFMELDFRFTLKDGRVGEMIHGSFFYPRNLLALADPELERAYGDLEPYIRGEIGRDLFADVVFSGSIMLGLICIPYGLSVAERERLAYVVTNQFSGMEDGDRRECAYLLYAGMKLVANRIDHPLP